MHLPRALRVVSLLVAGVTAGVVLRVAAAPPATCTVAPSYLGVP